MAATQRIRKLTTILAVDAVGYSRLMGQDEEATVDALTAHRRTIDDFIERLRTAKTVIWNGPLGFFEHEEFAHGTMRVGEALANLSGAKTIIGGGDTAAAVGHQPWSSGFTHISTGGGATLEYLEGKVLPGVKALEV